MYLRADNVRIHSNEKRARERLATMHEDQTSQATRNDYTSISEVE